MKDKAHCIDYIDYCPKPPTGNFTSSPTVHPAPQVVAYEISVESSGWLLFIPNSGRRAEAATVVCFRRCCRRRSPCRFIILSFM